MNDQLISCIISLNSTSKGKHFLREFLTESEQVMLAKRLMIIFMLSEGISQYRIKQVLKVSPATVFKLADNLDGNAYRSIIEIIQRKQNRTLLIKKLEVIMRLGLPSMGKERWDWLKDMHK